MSRKSFLGICDERVLCAELLEAPELLGPLTSPKRRSKLRTA